MAVLVVTPPDPLVSLEEAKAHLKVTTDDEDDLIEIYVAAASAHVDGPFGILKRAVGRQTLEVRANVFTGIGRLPLESTESITSVVYIDHEGVERMAEPELYSLTEGLFGLAPGFAWPRLRGDANGVRVRYLAGFDPVPTPIKQAVLLMVAQWFRNRMAVNVGNVVNEMPNGVKALLAPYKIWSV